MLEQIFGSDSRAKIIKLFCTHHDQRFFLRELSRRLDLTVNTLSRELNNLELLGFLKSFEEKQKKYYSANTHFQLFQELRALIVKSVMLLETELVRQMQAMKGIRVLYLTGIFINQPTDTDILIVGPVERSKVQRLISALSKAFYQDLRFTLLTTAEYKYRFEVSDKFISNIINLSPIIIIDTYSQ